jgi:hypothetical protein
VMAVEIEDIVLPDNMQRAMAKEAEAERRRLWPRKGNTKPRRSSARPPTSSHCIRWALQLRTLRTMAEIATEKNSTIVFPAQFMTTVQGGSCSLEKGFRIELG